MTLNYTPPEWRTTSIPPVPMNMFGKDHWSTFAYIETCAVDHKGLLDVERMRIDSVRHPMLAAAKRYGRDLPSGGYPTRLKTAYQINGAYGIVERYGHDDYDC